MRGAVSLFLDSGATPDWFAERVFHSPGFDGVQLAAAISATQPF
jgi:hypothetical protein